MPVQSSETRIIDKYRPDLSNEMDKRKWTGRKIPDPSSNFKSPAAAPLYHTLGATQNNPMETIQRGSGMKQL